MKRNNEMTKAATTNLVEDVFESFFPEQMDKSFTNNLNLVSNLHSTFLPVSTLKFSYS